MTAQRRRMHSVAMFIICLTAMSAAAGNWWFSAGPVYRGGMEVTTEGTSRTQAGGVHAVNPLRSPSGVGSTRSYANRSYDDGYVNMGPGTGNPASVDPSVTWYWGYDNGSQYNAGAGTLTFHRSGVRGYQEVRNTALDLDEDMDGFGVELVAGLPLRREGKIAWDLCVGVQGIPGAEAALSGSSYEEGIGRLDVTDVYDVSGVRIPGAPYRGTYDGPFGTPPQIPSPTIPNIPERRSTTLRDLSWSARNRIALDVEADICMLWLGPRLAVHPAEGLALHVTPRITGSLVDVSVDRTEIFGRHEADGSSTVLQRWSDSGSESAFVFGAGAALGAEIELGDGFFAGTWGSYEWVSEDVDVHVGPNTVSVDVGGFAAGAAIGRRLGGGPKTAPPAARIPMQQLLRELEAVDRQCRRPHRRGPDPVAAPHPVPDPDPIPSPAGQDLYTQLLHLLRTTRDVETVRQMIRVTREHRPLEFAALLAYARDRKQAAERVAAR